MNDKYGTDGCVAMRDAIGYIRVSTEDQAREGVSLDAQQGKIFQWAELNDCKVTVCYSDAGLSGGRADNRPGLQKALAHVCKSKGVLIVYSLSRLARSTKDAISISEQLDKAGADLVSLSEKIDTTSAAGKMIYRLLSVLAEFERDQLSERTVMAMDHLRSQNRRISGKLPYGYDLLPDGKTLAANDSEQIGLNLIIEAMEQGETLAGIRSRLRKAGIKSKHGKTWQLSSIQSVLRRLSRGGIRNRTVM